MLDFYFTSYSLCLGLGMASAVSVLIQTAVLILGVFRYRSMKERFGQITMEILITAQTVLMALLMAQVLHNMQSGYIPPTGFDGFRYTVWGLLCLAALLNRVVGKTLKPLAAPVAAALTLPFLEDVSGSLFPGFYIAALVLWTVRGLYCVCSYSKELRTSVSVSSIKESIDALPTGILFCAPDGAVILINRQMQEVVQAVTGRQHRNGFRLMEELARSDPPGFERSRFEDNLLYRFPDGSAWMFTENRIKTGRRDCVQLTASDVTERWRVTAQLQAQNAEVQRRGKELKETLDNLEEISRAETALRIRTHIHNTLGQEIALLLHALREKKKPDVVLLQNFIRDLPRALKEESLEQTPEKALVSLQAMLADIDVRLTVCGALPERNDRAAVLLAVITEAVTNAVRHGFASDITVCCQKDHNGWNLTVQDQGKSAGGSFIEGGGIRGMREKVAALGGALVIDAGPPFTVTAVLPEGGAP